MLGYNAKKAIEDDIGLIEKSLDWPALIRKYTPIQVCEALEYKKGMRLASNVVCSNFRDDTFVKYAIDVLFSIRKSYSGEWSKDWKNDAYLSGLCTMIWEYDESYKVLLEACEKSRDPPASLLYKLANCYNYPPEFSLMSEANAEEFLKKSFSKEQTCEAATRLKEIYKARNEIELYKYYDNMAKEAEKNNKHIEKDMTPDVLENE